MVRLGRGHGKDKLAGLEKVMAGMGNQGIDGPWQRWVIKVRKCHGRDEWYK